MLCVILTSKHLILLHNILVVREFVLKIRCAHFVNFNLAFCFNNLFLSLAKLFEDHAVKEFVDLSYSFNWIRKRHNFFHSRFQILNRIIENRFLCFLLEKVLWYLQTLPVCFQSSALFLLSLVTSSHEEVGCWLCS